MKVYPFHNVFIITVGRKNIKIFFHLIFCCSAAFLSGIAAQIFVEIQVNHKNKPYRGEIFVNVLQKAMFKLHPKCENLLPIFPNDSLERITREYRLCLSSDVHRFPKADLKRSSPAWS